MAPVVTILAGEPETRTRLSFSAEHEQIISFDPNGWFAGPGVGVLLAAAASGLVRTCGRIVVESRGQITIG